MAKKLDGMVPNSVNKADTFNTERVIPRAKSSGIMPSGLKSAPSSNVSAVKATTKSIDATPNKQNSITIGRFIVPAAKPLKHSENASVINSPAPVRVASSLKSNTDKKPIKAAPIKKVAENYLVKWEKTLDMDEFEKNLDMFKVLEAVLNERGRSGIMEDELKERLQAAGQEGKLAYAKSVLKVMNFDVFPFVKQDANAVRQNDYSGKSGVGVGLLLKRIGKTKESCGHGDYIQRNHPYYVDPESFHIGDRVVKVFADNKVSHYIGKVLNVRPAVSQVMVMWPSDVAFENSEELINLSMMHWAPPSPDGNISGLGRD